jgi:hypothetical protein
MQTSDVVNLDLETEIEAINFRLIDLRYRIKDADEKAKEAAQRVVDALEAERAELQDVLARRGAADRR